tara:strand:+ start:24130 stop:29892 length:5763 start_codon:yes stop_codon:yes gene_type:complete
MARCINKNLSEFKEVANVMGSPILANSLITSWQDSNNSDLIPTVTEALEFDKKTKALFNLKRREFTEALYANLVKEKILTKYKGNYYIVSSKNRIFDPNIRKFNKGRLYSYLRINNIDSNSIVEATKGAGLTITINQSIFTPRDIISESRDFDTPHAREVVRHLMRMFPQVKVKMLSVKDAKALYDALPNSQKVSGKSKVNFDNVKSFYVNETAILIRGRVTNDIAVEEILHPFIDGVSLSNEKLFEGLVAESKKSFPELWEGIKDAYNQNRGFTEKHRELELVTQALSRHFNKENNEVGTVTFRRRVKDFLEWFLDIIKDLHEYISGRPLTVDMISANATLTSIAKLLNTENIEFKLTTLVDNKVRYNLSPEKKQVYDYISVRGNAVQQSIIETMFHAGVNSPKQVGSLAASTITDGDPILVLDEATHTYQDINDLTSKWTSATTAINGKMSDEVKAEIQLNLDLGNDFDSILDGLATDKSLGEIMPNLKVLNQEQSGKAYAALQANLALLTQDGSIAIPQVVVYDQATGMAGSIDLLLVKPNGTLKIVDLKTSRTSIFEKTLKGKLKYDDISNYDTLNEDSVLAQKGLTKGLSKRQKHNLQVNLYRRMLENMGYTVSNEEGATSTIHIKVDITGKGKNQKFKGGFKSEGEQEQGLKGGGMRTEDWLEHPVSQNQLYVDAIVPLNVNKFKKEQITEATGQSPESKQVFDLNDAEQKPDEVDAESSGKNSDIAYEVIGQSLMNYQLGLVKKQEVINSTQGKAFLGRHQTVSQVEESVLNAISAVNIALAGSPTGRSRTYTALLRDSLKQINEFQAYVEDPANFGKAEYISYVLNFDKFLSTFEGLYALGTAKGLNSSQKTLVLQLQTKANEMVGVGGFDNYSEGVIDKAVMSYVRSVVETTSDREFTKDQLDELLKMGEEIGVIDFQTRDMATAEDTLLAVMDKIYKVKKQELLDKIQTREGSIRRAAQKLQELSGVANIESPKQLKKLYEFMLIFDENGEFSGRYVQELGNKYYDKQEELRAPLFDEQGQPYQFRDVTDLSTAKPEDIEYNIKLAEAKKTFGKFFNAETIGLNDQPIPGEYHDYTEEFKIARNIHEYFVPAGDNGYWKRRKDINDQNWFKYESKYKKTGIDNESVIIALKDQDGKYTGAIKKDMLFPRVKTEYRIAREKSGYPSNEDMRSEKFKAIQNDKTALGLARKEFYDLFRTQYENELLTKLPKSQRTQMLGRVPLIRGRVTQDIRGKGVPFAKAFAKTSKGVKNLFRTTSQQRTLITDEKNNVIDTMAIFYTGRPADDKQLAAIDEKIQSLNQERKEGKLKFEEYKNKIAVLEGERVKIEGKPTKGELNLDMGNGLLKFASMAEHYETMSTVEDTFKAMLEVIKRREYQPAGGKIKTGVKKALGFEAKGSIKGSESNVLRRAKKWMSMVYYDNDQMTKGFFDKAADGLIQLSSLSYVAFNPFGNFNNYVLGRLNDNIEAIGGRFYSAKAFARASTEWNKRALPDMIHRLSSMAKKPLFKNDYDPEMPTSKYEAFADLYRMMDSDVEIRESGSTIDRAGKSYFKRFMEWGYVLQDAAEWNVQTKVGMAMLMDTFIKNKNSGEILSLYDAHEFDSATKSVKLKDGFTTIVEIDNKNLDKDGKPQLLKEVGEYTDEYRYKFRNKIREVNKQIHGNYSSEDRMVLQSSTVGKLASQFHKWVAPAARARFQREYFDENLGWMEGRYLGWWKFVAYSSSQVAKGNFKFNKFSDGFLEDQGFIEGGSRQDNQRAKDKLFGFYRTMGEIGIIMMTMVVKELLAAGFGDTDDDDEITRKFKNIALYQADRTFQELILFTPFGGDQIYQMVKSPIASTRTMGELTQALYSTIETPYQYFTSSNSEFWANSSVVYQRGSRSGSLKWAKEWQDAIPILYSIKKWESYNDMKNFFIK